MKTKIKTGGIQLTSLLTRRRTPLSKFLLEQGITTYELLVERCGRMGVEPPDRHDFDRHKPEEASSPTEGVVVMEPPSVFLESSGEELEDVELSYVSDPYPPIKSRRKKKQ